MIRDVKWKRKTFAWSSHKLDVQQERFRLLPAEIDIISSLWQCSGLGPKRELAEVKGLFTPTLYNKDKK